MTLAETWIQKHSLIMMELTQQRERSSKIGNLMINGSGLMEGSAIFPRKYLNVIITCVWHIRGLMNSLFFSMSILAFLKLVSLLVYATLAIHRETNCLTMGWELRNRSLRTIKSGR